MIAIILSLSRINVGVSTIIFRLEKSKQWQDWTPSHLSSSLVPLPHHQEIPPKRLCTEETYPKDLSLMRAHRRNRQQKIINCGISFCWFFRVCLEALLSSHRNYSPGREKLLLRTLTLRFVQEKDDLLSEIMSRLTSKPRLGNNS